MIDWLLIAAGLVLGALVLYAVFYVATAPRPLNRKHWLAPPSGERHDHNPMG